MCSEKYVVNSRPEYNVYSKIIKIKLAKEQEDLML